MKAGDTIDNARCGGECGRWLPKLSMEDERNNPNPIHERITARQRPRGSDGGGGDGHSCRSRQSCCGSAGRPWKTSTTSSDDRSAAAVARPRHDADLPSVSSSSSSSAAVPSRPARNLRATSDRSVVGDAAGPRGRRPERGHDGPQAQAFT